MSGITEALSAMQRLCSMRECCRADILKRLKRFQLTEKEESEIIQTLEDEKFLDQRRFAGAFVRDKSILAGWGPAKIRWQLRIKGVEGDIINEALKSISTDNQDEKLISLLSKKRASIKESAPDKVREKLIRFALSRGFEYEKVLWALNKIMAKFVPD